jgi:DeoR/GlpR family transcriptional regulator of sugar metabolism
MLCPCDEVLLELEKVSFAFVRFQFKVCMNSMSTSEPLFLEERRRAIMEELKLRGRVSVKSLSAQMNVSAVTIRQDLRALEKDGLLERTYGGAVLGLHQGVLSELSFDTRQLKFREEKRAIGAAAARLVQNGDTIALDASTTAFAITPFLTALEDVIVVTNSLIIAQQFVNHPRIEVVMPGGGLRRDSVSLVGAPETLPDINVNIGFFGAHGLTLDEGITEISPEEVIMKQAMIERCQSIVIVADSSKWDKVAPFTYISAQAVARVITTEYAPRDVVKDFRAAGVEVEAADVISDPIAK